MPMLSQHRDCQGRTLVKASAEQAGRARNETRRPVEAALRSCRKGLIGIGIFSCIMNVLLLTGPFFMLQI